MSWIGGPLPDAAKAASSGFTRSKMAPSRVDQFLSRFAGPAIGGTLFGPGGLLLGGALSTKEAQRARRDPNASPFEFGLSEGLGSIWNAGDEARKDQSSVWPELGLSEMVGKTFGADRAAPEDFVEGRTAASGAGVGSAVGKAGAAAAGTPKAKSFLKKWAAPLIGAGLGALAGGGWKGAVGGGLLGAGLGHMLNNRNAANQKQLAAAGAGAGSDAAEKMLMSQWAADTAGSPAAQAGFSDTERYERMLNNQQWLKDRGRPYDLSLSGILR